MMPQVNIIKTGENIKFLMRSSDLSVKAIQEILGFSTPQAVYKWFRGQSLPTIDNLVILADLFSCTIDDILIIERS